MYLEFGFTTLPLHRVYGKCDELNHASVRVMERCGLKYEGTIREHVWLCATGDRPGIAARSTENVMVSRHQEP